MLPRDEPVAVAAGPDPDKVLLVGGGPVAGVGVASHQDALAGALARQLFEHSRRGAVVEAVGRIDLRVADIPELVTSRRPERFDAIVIIIGMTEAIAMTPRKRWARELAAVLEVVHAQQPRDSIMMMTGMPARTTTGGIRGWGGRLADRRAVVLDRTSRATVTSSGLGHFAQLAPSPHVDGHPTVTAYTDWASQICAVLEPILSLDRQQTGAGHADPVPTTSDSTRS